MVHSAPTGLESGHSRHLAQCAGARQEKAMVEEKNKKKDFVFSARMPRIPIGCPVKRKNK